MLKKSLIAAAVAAVVSMPAFAIASPNTSTNPTPATSATAATTATQGQNVDVAMNKEEAHESATAERHEHHAKRHKAEHHAKRHHKAEGHEAKGQK
ncbi:MAG TPA: hypothetical protein VGV92_04915 [Gammaproteobacteria bacterium]|nr:hypothetical protein [Gammaproteobacteria bacterium]